MFSRYGLRVRMAMSYVVISAAAVLAADAVLLALATFRINNANDNAARVGQSAAQALSFAGRTRVKETAVAAAEIFDIVATDISAAHVRLSGQALRVAVAREGFQASFGRRGIAGVLAFAAPDGTVVQSTAPSEFPYGSALPVPASGASAAGSTEMRGRRVWWAASPVVISASAGAARTSREGRPIGLVYALLPVSTWSLAHAPSGQGTSWVFQVGAIVLALLVPLGVLFGLLSTRKLIGQIRRLAEGATAMAGGDLEVRIPVSGGGEVGQLEEGFNRMAGQLGVAVQAARDLAGAQARRTERTRIARELHDSISQDLFSANLLAGAIRRALPDGTPSWEQAEVLERTLNHTMREMRALLLELRPVLLDDAGLAQALHELCQGYRTRLGVSITAHIADLDLQPDTEHVVLRVAQEALGNAARHAGARVIELNVACDDGHIAVTVSDDGCGFDPAKKDHRHGMGLDMMRERVTECGGTLEVRSLPGQGTAVLARLPAAEGAG